MHDHDLAVGRDRVQRMRTSVNNFREWLDSELRRLKQIVDTNCGGSRTLQQVARCELVSGGMCPARWVEGQTVSRAYSYNPPAEYAEAPAIPARPFLRRSITAMGCTAVTCRWEILQVIWARVNYTCNT